MESGRSSHKLSVRGLVCAILSLCFIGIAVYALVQLGSGYMEEKQAQKEFDVLADMMTGIETANDQSDASSQSESAEEFQAVGADEMPEQSATEDREMIPEFQTLSAINSDIAGWIYSPNALISYPVMWTPDDPEYYLRRDFYKNSSRSGTPFIGAACTVDSDCLIIYGHNMKYKTMFSALSNYGEQKFWEENPTIIFNTLYEYREYQIFAAVTCRLSEDEEAGTQFYQYSGDMTETQFDKLRNYLCSNAAYDTGIMPEYGDQILIVATCGNTYSDERFLVAAFRTPNE